MKNDEYYTPEPIMEIIDKYVEDKFGYDRKDFIKPFYPGGDYENEDYTGKIVVDNPPFSILSKIVDYYIEKNIKFFLFGPTLTINSTIMTKGVSCLVIKPSIIYKNDIAINTCFITNIPEKPYIVFDKELSDKIEILYPKKSFVRNIPGFINALLVQVDRKTEPVYLDDYDFVRIYEGKKIPGEGYIKKGK